MEKFGAKHKKLMLWLQRSEAGMLLESQVVASGMSAALDDLMRAGLATIDSHPTVMERTSPPIPAAAVMLTPAGREWHA